MLDGPVTDFSESIFFTGNGVLGVRGFSLQTPKESPEDHAIFRAGFFEPVKPGITDMVQLPDVLSTVIAGYIPGHIRQTLCLRTGMLTRSWSADGLSVQTEQIVSMADAQLICIRMTLTADSDREVEINAEMNPRVANLPVCDDQTVEEKETVCLLNSRYGDYGSELHHSEGSGTAGYLYRPDTAIPGECVRRLPDAAEHDGRQ